MSDSSITIDTATSRPPKKRLSLRPASAMRRSVSDRDRESGDNVGNVGVDDHLNLVLQLKLATLQARQLQLVAGRLRREKLNALIEFAMLGLEVGEQSLWMIVIHRLNLPQNAPRGEKRAARAQP